MSFVDLHIHSEHSSDGEWSVRRIWAKAHHHGLQAFSISDHDTVEGVAEGWKMKDEFAPRLIPNVEVSTNHRGHKFHLLAPFVEWRSPQLEDFLEDIRQSRLETSYHDDEASARYLELAEELDLTPTAGSDFHGKVKPKVAFGSVRQGNWDRVEELRRRREVD